MAQFQIYNFNSEIVENYIFRRQNNQDQILTQALSNARKYKKQNIIKYQQNNNVKQIKSNYSIQKYKKNMNPETLQIQKKNQNFEININSQHKKTQIIQNCKDICDFIDQDQQLQKKDKSEHDIKKKDIFDFVQDQQQEKQIQQQQKSDQIQDNKNRVQYFEDLNIKQDQDNSQFQKDQQKIKKPKHIDQYFVYDQSLFLKNHIPANTQLKCLIKPQYFSSRTIFHLFLQKLVVATCIHINKIFLFECNDGPIAKMEIINNVYQISIFDDEIDMKQQSFASIYFQKHLIQNKKFSSMQIYINKTRDLNRSPKSQFSHKKNTIKLFKSRNPYINKYGNLQLKIENSNNVRPSNFNCIIQDSNSEQVCSLFHTNAYEVNIKYPFNPLLGAACAIARLQWNREQKQ